MLILRTVFEPMLERPTLRIFWKTTSGRELPIHNCTHIALSADGNNNLAAVLTLHGNIELDGVEIPSHLIERTDNDDTN